jgi:hypothetical protein
MEKRMKDGHFVDGEIQKVIQSESKKWRNILKCILQAIVFSAKYNLALRGSNDKIGVPNAGVFHDIMEVISYHTTALKDMISKHNAKYFSLLFYCTSDVSHQEQMSQIIRYVSVSDGNVSVKDSFIYFIHAHGKNCAMG